jgi:hypothetical protein
MPALTFRHPSFQSDTGRYSISLLPMDQDFTWYEAFTVLYRQSLYKMGNHNGEIRFVSTLLKSSKFGYFLLFGDDLKPRVN